MFDLIASSLGCNVAHGGQTGFVSKGPLDDYWYGPRGAQTSSGLRITEDVAMTYATVFSCIAKISKTVASLPRFVFERKPSVGSRFDNKEVQTSHDLHEVLHDTPNDEMDKRSYEESQMANLLGWGNRYSEIVRHNRTRRVKQLWPIPSKEITPVRDKQGRIQYEWRQSGRLMQTIPADRMLAIPGFSFDGLVGLSPIGLQRESIGLGMTAAKFGAKLFDNGAVLRGVLETPKRLGDTAYKRLKDSFSDEFQGWEKAHGTIILEEDTKYTSVGINPDDAQFLETRSFQAIEICGIFDVPPPKIGILDHATFSNIEAQAIQWVVDTIGIWCIAIEQAMNRQLLDNDPRFFVEHVVGGLLRGDIESRYNAYAQGRQNGFLSTNDIRHLENLNPKPGGDDDFLTPLNMRIGNEPLPDNNTGQGGSTDDNDNNAKASRWMPVVEDVARRMVTKEVKAVENAFKRTAKGGHAHDFLCWAGSFYCEHESHTAAALVPVITSILGPSGAQAISERAARKYTAISFAAVRDCVRDDASRLPQELNSWLHGKPSKIETLAAEWCRLLH